MAIRQKIVELAQHVSGRKENFNEKDPEYYVFADIVNDLEADLIIAMERRKEEKVEDLAKRTNLTYEKTFEICMHLTDLGILELKPQSDGSDKFELPIYVPGIFELMMLNRDHANSHPEIARAFEEYTRSTVEKVVTSMPMGNGAMRVIPVESAIKADTRKAPFEEISYWLTKYQNHIALAPCQCRLVRQQMGEGTGNLPEEMCLILGATAESCIATGKARRINRKEADEVLKLAEKRGYMHQVSNMDGTNKIWAICNCERNVCLALRTSQYFHTPNMSRSNYVAHVDSKKCSGCGQCVETCPANAVKLGSNLCTKEKVEFLNMPLPDDHNWDKNRYNPNFRENFENTLESGAAPCKATCPAHISVQGYIKLAAQGKYTEALELIKKENPFPAVCGRICPHPCESECTRNQIDESVAIDDIKKFIADRELEEKNQFVPEKLFDYHNIKIAIVGGGPSGLSCAFFLAQKGYSITVFEKLSQPGGMLKYGIPSFRLEKNVINSEIEVLKKLGVQFKCNVEVGKDITLDQLREKDFKAFYIAIGAQGGRKLGIKGEDNKSVIAGVDFLRDVNMGKKVNTPGNVVVIGGGNVAIDVARTAVRTGSDSVKMFCLENKNEMPAQDEEVAEAKNENININNSWGPTRIIVENNKITGVEFKRCLSVFNEKHQFSPKFDEKNTQIIPADTVLISIGQSIEWKNLLEGSKVKLRRGNTAIADSLTLQTDQSDIFVGGDVYTGPKFAIDAIAAGKEGADSLHRFVHPGQTLHLGRNRREFLILDKENVDYSSYDSMKREKVGHDISKDFSFRDPRSTLTEEQVKKETKRCLECGAAHVDPNQCIGCGECTVRCKFEAITLSKEFNAKSVGYENIKPHALKRIIGRKINIAFNPNRDSMVK